MSEKVKDQMGIVVSGSKFEGKWGARNGQIIIRIFADFCHLFCYLEENHRHDASCFKPEGKNLSHLES